MTHPLLFRYNGKGLWFDPPTLLMRKGRYSIQSPSWLHPFLDNNQNLGENASFQSFSDALDPERRASGVAKAYRKHIITTLSQFIASSNQQQQPQRLGALILEPIIQGAGGMMLIDPLFQVELVDIVRNPGLWHPKVKSTTSNEVIVPPPLPVVFDEVFVGMYRLGDKLPSAAQMLQRLSASSNLKPDIACYAKSLTGGLLPLAVTLASSSVFDVFLSSEKQAALLHGHSYTAHPIGCSVAVRSLETYLEKAARKEEESDSVWPREKLEVLSSHDKVAGLVAIGRVLAVTLQDNRGGGYVSTGASGKIVAKLRNEFNIFARPLGPVVYLMVRQNADAEVIRSLADSLIISIDECFK